MSTASGRFEAAPAASCLLSPAPGDRVLVAVPPEGVLYILSVLERDASAPVEIALGDDVRLRAGRRLTLEAPNDVALCGHTVRLASQELEVSAAEGVFAIKKASFMSGAMQLYVDVVTALVTRVESHIENLSVHAKHSQRYVEGLDLVRAGSVDVRADQAVKIRGENTFVAADELVKLDGEQIHLG